MEGKKLDSMRMVDIRSVDKEELVDLKDVVIDEKQPVPDRIAQFVAQIRNPYCFRIGDIAVKVVYQEKGPTFQQNFVDLLRIV